MQQVNLPALTLSFFARSTTSGIQSRASPTQTTVDKAIHRWPAAPNAAPTSAVNVASLLASGRITPWFFAAYKSTYIIHTHYNKYKNCGSNIHLGFFFWPRVKVGLMHLAIHDPHKYESFLFSERQLLCQPITTGFHLCSYPLEFCQYQQTSKPVVIKAFAFS